MTGELARTEPPTALTDGAAVDLRPQWNLDGKSVVFERHEAGQSRLFQLHLEGWRRGDCEALAFCNRDARHVQGRAAFFAQYREKKLRNVIGSGSAALGNAVFDATGIRLRNVPFTKDRVRTAFARL